MHAYPQYVGTQICVRYACVGQRLMLGTFLNCSSPCILKEGLLLLCLRAHKFGSTIRSSYFRESVSACRGLGLQEPSAIQPGMYITSET